MFYTILIILSAVFADQLSKYLVMLNMTLGESIPVIPKVLSFTYIRNDGAVFGILDDHRWVFMIFSTVAIAAMLIWLFVDRSVGPWTRSAAALIVGGGIGNMIDRVAYGEVVDFIDVTLVHSFFPYIFNIADCCVCVGCGMLFVGLIAESIKESKAKKKTVAAEAEQGGSTLSLDVGEGGDKE